MLLRRTTPIYHRPLPCARILPVLNEISISPEMMTRVPGRNQSTEDRYLQIEDFPFGSFPNLFCKLGRNWKVKQRLEGWVKKTKWQRIRTWKYLRLLLCPSLEIFENNTLNFQSVTHSLPILSAVSYTLLEENSDRTGSESSLHAPLYLWTCSNT